MRRFLFAAVVAGIAWHGIGETVVRAQSWQLGTNPQPQVRQRSPISPYINMLGRGGTAVDYYGIVRPQMDANRSIGALQQGFSSLMTDGSTLPAQMPQNTVNALGGMQTGHATSYFNYGRYYPLSYGSPGSGGSGYGTTGPGSATVRPFFSNSLNSYQVR